MKKIILLLFLAQVINLYAQENKKYLLTNSDYEFGPGAIQLTDNYLSPLDYSGLALNFSHSTQRYLSPEILDISIKTDLSSTIGLTANPAITADMAYIGFNYKWGMLYHFRPSPNLQLLAGANAGLTLGFKANSRNVNNPFNGDISTDLNLAGIARYVFYIFKKKCRLNYSLETPVIGCMMVPGENTSYYEIFELNDYSSLFHFSSIYNKLGLNSSIMVDIPFKHSTLVFGVKSSTLKYTANNMFFEKKDKFLMLGYRYNLHIFSGTADRAPANFINCY